MIQSTSSIPTPSSASSSETFSSVLSSQHRPDWEKANSKARYHIRICLDQDDRREIEELEKAREVWTHFRSKYNKTFAADAMRLAKQFVNYQMTEEDTVRAAWIHLQNLGTRIAEIDPSQGRLKKKEERIKYLLAALPESYKSTKQAIQVQPHLTPDEILLLLQSQEAEANQESETAMFASRGRRYQSSGSTSGKTVEDVKPQRSVFSHVQIPVRRQETTGHQDNWEMDGISAKDPSETAEQKDDQPKVNHGQKRSREEEEDQDRNEPESKVSREMFSQLGGFKDSEDFEPIDWALAVADGIVESIPIPNTYQEATSDPEWVHLWKEAVVKEIESTIGNLTWEETALPKNANLTTSKWVFTVKRTTAGSVERFKARLVARGFSQKYGIDFEDTFAPTVRHDTLRAFLAVVCSEDLELHSMDVNNAFTESVLKEDIYMKPPPGLELPPGKVLHILKSLYGLKQAARDWNQLCVSELMKSGFIQSEAEPCLFTLPERGLIILVYVHDLAVAAPKLDDVQWFKKEFGKVFKLKDLGETDKILGMRVIRDREKGTLTIDQAQYVKDVLAKLRMNKDKAHPVWTPIGSYEALRKIGPEDTRCDREEYQWKVGHWMYLGS